MFPAIDDPEVRDRYGLVLREFAAVAAVVNVAHARLAELVELTLAECLHAGPGMKSPAQFVAMRTGMSIGVAQNLVRIVKRREDLPCLWAAFQAGELSLDQAATVARHVTPDYDESATSFAKVATVAQLKSALPAYGYEKRTKPVDHGVHTGTDENGWWMRARASDSVGAMVDQALRSAREDLWNENKRNTPKGEDVPSVSSEEALEGMAEGFLRAGEAARPGSERYRVHLHCEQGPDGKLMLSTHMGVPLADGDRRHILCDPHIQALLQHGTTPLSVGRETRWINRKLRRAIQHRDRGCRVPGCGSKVGLEIHHIWHWEDGGPTSTWNLLTLCRTHHTAHHHGQLGIVGDAELPFGTNGAVEYRDQWGHLLDQTGTPTSKLHEPAHHAQTTTPGEGAADAARAAGLTPSRYTPPCGERLNRRDMHLTPKPPPDKPGAPTPPGDGPIQDPNVDTPPPTELNDTTRSSPNGPTSGRPPSRAEPPRGTHSPTGPPHTHAPPAA